MTPSQREPGRWTRCSRSDYPPSDPVIRGLHSSCPSAPHARSYLVTFSSAELDLPVQQEVRRSELPSGASHLTQHPYPSTRQREPASRHSPSIYLDPVRYNSDTRRLYLPRYETRSKTSSKTRQRGSGFARATEVLPQSSRPTGNSRHFNRSGWQRISPRNSHDTKMHGMLR